MRRRREEMSGVGGEKDGGTGGAGAVSELP